MSHSCSRRQFVAASAIWLASMSTDRTASRSSGPRPKSDGVRVAALFDIHGNLPALEAVLDDLKRVGVDEIVVGGDVFPGPMASEVLSRLTALSIPVHFIKGNGDRVVVTARAGGDISEVPAAYRDVIRWNAGTLTDDAAKRIGEWPRTIRVDVAGLGEVLFCHATPRNDTEIFTRLTERDRLVAVFEGIRGVVVCGHTHMQFDRTIGSARIVNAGSVGMPFGRPGAYWLLLGPGGAELRRKEYDLDAAARRVRNTKYPKAEEFADRNILRPPSEDEMLAAYSRVELR
jgi:putative phosphoesterase